jgi:pilus assembly protein TadC
MKHLLTNSIKELYEEFNTLRSKENFDDYNQLNIYLGILGFVLFLYLFLFIYTVYLFSINYNKIPQNIRYLCIFLLLAVFFGFMGGIGLIIVIFLILTTSNNKI